MIRIIFIICVLLTPMLHQGQEENYRPLYRTDSGFISFVSAAPLELITAKSNSLQGLVDPEKGTFAFQLETQTLTGFNSPLQQEHFYENYIETEKFPKATFNGKIIEKVDFEAIGEQSIRAKGILEIHGEKKERIIRCDLEIGRDQFTAISTFMINLDDHNILIPKLVYQKIAEEVEVNIRLTLKKGTEGLK